MNIGDCMVCKKCGVELPRTGFVCTNCGCMMDAQQIKEQKRRAKYSDNNFKHGFFMEQYGLNKMLFQKREEKKNFGIFFFFLFLLFFFVLVGMLVYFA